MLDIETTLRTYDYTQIADANTRTLAQRAADDIKPRLRRATEDILVIGQRLAVVRQYLPHGQWMAWLDAEFEMGEITARNFINVATRFADKSSKFEDLKPSALYMLAAPSTPDDAIVEVETLIAAGSIPTVAETKQIIADHKGHGRCAKCNRTLTDPGSIAAGVGPCCATHNHAGNGNGQGADAESDTEAQFVTAAWDIPTEQSIDDLPVYGMSDDDVDVVYARGKRKSMTDEEDTPTKIYVEVYGEHGDQIQAARIVLESDEEIGIVKKTPHVSHNSGNNEWYTPAEYIEAARRVMGEIELDPATSQEANRVVRAQSFYTAADDGLSQKWQGRVWMNPPYAAPLISMFCGKLAEHYASGDVPEAIALVNNATETAWFGTLVQNASAVVFPQSRVRFWQPDGTLGAPLQGQAIVYMGGKPKTFLAEFGRFGWEAHIE